MNSKFKRIKTMAAAAALSAAVSLATPALGFVSLAATGTVTGSDINVRSEASSSSSQVGTVTTGDTVTVGETATDDSGATWYQVTLSNGTTGYVRGDFLTVSEDDTSTDASTDGDTAATDDTSTDASSQTDAAAADATQAAEQDTGGYQVVLAPDENGEDTYYLYDNNAGQRMKISDIGKLQDDVNAANQEAASVKTRYNIFLIVLGAAAIILAIACILLVLKLRDALANGRRERDLTMERRDQRRNNSRADSVESLRARDRNAGPSRTGRGRDDAYASGARRLERGDDMRDPRDARAARPAARPARPAAGEDGYAARPASRPVRPAGDAEGARTARPARPARPEGDVRTDRPARPAADAARRPAAPARKQPAKNFADDDFDYDFLKPDDKDE